MCSKLSPPGIYLLRWGGLGEGGGGVAGAARLCHGRSRRDRHEPVFVPNPQDYCGIDVECDAALTTTWNKVQQNLSAKRHTLRWIEMRALCQNNTIQLDLGQSRRFDYHKTKTYMLVCFLTVQHECVTQGEFMCYFGNKSYRNEMFHVYSLLSCFCSSTVKDRTHCQASTQQYRSFSDQTETCLHHGIHN